MDAMSTLDELPLPAEVRSAIPTREQFLAQSATVATSPWRHEVAARELPPPTGLFQAHPTAHLTRGGILDAAARDITPGNALQLLYLTLAWSAAANPGVALYGLAPASETAAVLTDAWDNARDGLEATECYSRIARRRQGERLLRLSPARLTTFLSFAQGHPRDSRGALAALDAASVLGLATIDADSPFSRRTSADAYGRYCRLLARWAAEASTSDNVVGSDQVQAAVASLGQHLVFDPTLN